MSGRLDELTEVVRRAQQMFDHGSPMTHLFAATVLGAEPDTDGQRWAGTRVDGTTPPEPASEALTLARKTTGQLIDGAAAAAGKVVAAWRELRKLNPHARELGGPASARLWAALDQLDTMTTTRPDAGDDDMREWKMTTADDQPQGTYRGSRAGAVAAANERTEQIGQRVYTEPAGTTLTTAPETRSR